MANIVSVWKNAKGPEQSREQIDPLGSAPTQLMRQEHWCVLYDGNMDAKDVIGAEGLPTISTVPDSGGWYCVSHLPIRDGKNPYLFNVQVDYTATRQASFSGNPEVWSISVRKGSAAREERAFHDRLGLSLLNTAGFFLPELPNNTLYDTVWTFAWTSSLAPGVKFDTLEGKTNSDEVSFTVKGIHRSYTKSQMKCVSATCSVTETTQVEGGTTTVKRQYSYEVSFQIRLPKWVWKSPNVGFKGYRNSGTNEVEIVFKSDTKTDKDPNAQPAPEPTPMDLNGHRLSDSAPLILPDDVYNVGLQNMKNSLRFYDPDGAFELEDQTTFGDVLAPINDT